jgi:hypothetical protein
VTVQAYDKPMFVEDVVRDVALSLQGDQRVVWFLAHAKNRKSIHNHSAFAQIEWTWFSCCTTSIHIGDGSTCMKRIGGTLAFCSRDVFSAFRHVFAGCNGTDQQAVDSEVIH